MADGIFVRQKKAKNYTVLDNTCLKDNKLSLRAKGLHSYLMSLPEDWNIYVSELITHSADGRDSVYAAIKELENAGYIVRFQKRKENGSWDTTQYLIFETPQNSVEIKEKYLKKNNKKSDEKEIVKEETVESERNNNSEILENKKENNVHNDIKQVIKTDSVENKSNNIESQPLTGKPYTANPYTAKPDTAQPYTANPTLLNTNNTKYLNLKNTNELTELPTKTINQSEKGSSVFFKTIIKYFSDTNPFDEIFEKEIISLFERQNLNLEKYFDKYINYVFQKTKNQNPSKSFTGLFRKIALMENVFFDFLEKNNITKNKQEIKICPVCNSSRYEKYLNCCKECGHNFENSDEKNIEEEKKIWQLPEEKRNSLNNEIKKVSITAKDYDKKILMLYIKYGIRKKTNQTEMQRR